MYMRILVLGQQAGNAEKLPFLQVTLRTTASCQVISTTYSNVAIGMQHMLLQINEATTKKTVAIGSKTERASLTTKFIEMPISMAQSPELVANYASKSLPHDPGQNWQLHKTADEKINICHAGVH
ncbi:unnamed protein product [Notodromas monacha]|uniref:Uncharacterized protein n=1 Tax=Notodromas monacha TaxID=399045 RepID=A0A7R9BQT0_9CRUS|nr:unnamed protein product [Notodromas monacha]CAG0918620.1 unnamed protein product [Notodromas monacha]